MTADGHVVAGGDFSAVNWTARNGIAWLNPNGSVDTNFNPGAGFQVVEVDEFTGEVTRMWGGGVRTLQVTSDGSVLVGGGFARVDGVSQKAVARLNPNGSRDASFDLGTGFPGGGYWTGPTVASLVQQSDGRIVVGGSFQGFNGAFPSPFNVTRLLPVVVPPLAPSGLSVTNGDSTALVSFVGPASHGGAPVTNYEYSLDGGPWVARSPASTVAAVAVPGLVNGVARQVRVRAVNAAGPGVASVAVTVRPVVPVGSVFVPGTPVRVVESRVVFGGVGPVVAGSSRVVSVAAPAGGGPAVVPVGAVAVAYNVTVPGPGSAGHVRVMPGDAVGLTSASAINFRARETIANAATVKVAPDRTVKVYAGSTADVIVDVVGYFVPAAVGDGPVPSAAAAGRFTPVTPVRVYDAAADPGGLLAGGADRLVSTASTQAGGVPVVPVGASAVAYNVTVVETAGAGHVRVMPGDVASSSTSAINWSTAGERIANGSVVGVDADRQIRVFNGGGAPVRFLVDVVGYYSQAGQEFFPVDPVRTTDTRYAQGGAGPVAPVLPGARAVSVAATQAGGMAVVPAGVSAVAFNATVVATGSMGHLRVFPANAVLPTASVLNWPAAGYTRANATAVGVSPERQVTLYNGAGTPTDVLIDINGYYQ